MVSTLDVEVLCIEKSRNHHNVLVCDSRNGRMGQFAHEGFFNCKTVTKEQDPIVIATTPDRRNVASDLETNKIYPRNVAIAPTNRLRII